jgi:phage terminase large subunit-like protein
MKTKINSKINREAAERAVFFFKQLKHATGEYSGMPFTLMDWQRERIIEPLFGTLNKDGTRQYRYCYVEVPRKNGKTELGAGTGLYLLFADNEPGAQIYSAAGDRMQAGLIYQAASPMVRQAAALAKRSKIIDSQKRIIVQGTNSYYQVLSAEAYSKHGINAHGILFDELHTQPSRDLWDVLTTSCGSRRQPMVFVMTTAGYDRNSIGWEIHDYARKVQDGIIDDPTFLPVIYGAPEDADWTDEDIWYSCNPALGEFRSLDEMRALCKRAQETPALEMTFRRLYLNQWVNSVQRWLPMDKWDACSDPVKVEDLAGKPCYGGLDLSTTTDLTALSLVFPDGNSGYDVLAHFWIPEDTAIEKERKDKVPYREWARRGYITMTPGNVIDYDYIEHYLYDIVSKYKLKELAYDRYGSTQITQNLINAGAFTNDPKAEPDKTAIIPFGQGFISMSPPTKELMNLVLSKKIRHGNNPVLRWCADNLVVNQDPAGNLKPDKAKATQRIDGMVALIMALGRGMLYTEDNRPSIYETRGPLIYNL